MAKDSRQKLVSEEKNSEILDEEQELQIEINHSQSRFQKILARLKDKLASEVLELKALIKLAAPLTATYIALGLLQMTNLFFVVCNSLNSSLRLLRLRAQQIAVGTARKKGISCRSCSGKYLLQCFWFCNRRWNTHSK